MKTETVARSSTQTVVAALVTAITVLVIGYISAQIEGATKGYIVDLSGTPGVAIEKRYPFELQLALLLIGIAAIAAYRRVSGSRASRIAVVSVLGLAVVAAGVAFMPAQSTIPNLFSLSAVYGGVSPFTLALLACVVFDMAPLQRHEPSLK